MTGTLINIGTVLVGGAIGLFFGKQIPERITKTLIAGIGLFTAAIGIQMFLDNSNPIILLLSLMIGGLWGEWWRCDWRARVPRKGKSADFLSWGWS